MSEIFATVQAAAEYGRPYEALHEIMAAMYPGRRRYAFVYPGSIAGRVMGFPRLNGSYHTVVWGQVDRIEVSALAVGDIHTDADGVTWEVVANATSPGSAHWLGSHFFCAVEVVNE